MDDGFLGWIKYLENIVSVGAGIEVVTDIQILKVFVAVELLVIGISHRIEARLVLRGKHRFRITPKVRTRHGHDMHLVTANQLTQVGTQLVVRVGGYVVKLIHRNQPIIESSNAKLFDSKTEGGMGTHQNFIVTV